jgi:hypothetical protein
MKVGARVVEGEVRRLSATEFAEEYSLDWRPE